MDYMHCMCALCVMFHLCQCNMLPVLDGSRKDLSWVKTPFIDWGSCMNNSIAVTMHLPVQHYCSAIKYISSVSYVVLKITCWKVGKSAVWNLHSILATTTPALHRYPKTFWTMWLNNIPVIKNSVTDIQLFRPPILLDNFQHCCVIRKPVFFCICKC